MDFWFEFFDIHVNKQTTFCHDCHGFKWESVNLKKKVWLILFVI
jgi:hypothetical protein